MLRMLSHTLFHNTRFCSLTLTVLQYIPLYARLWDGLMVLLNMTFHSCLVLHWCPICAAPNLQSYLNHFPSLLEWLHDAAILSVLLQSTVHKTEQHACPTRVCVCRLVNRVT